MIPLLQGVKVVEMTSVLMGPFAGQILADLGAQVIKIEPTGGDISRDAGPAAVSGMGAMYVNNNRNKKVIALDVKTPAGAEVARRLISRTNVFFHNMRAQAAERLGLGFDAVSAINPHIVYCAAVGFGEDGRYRDLPAYDDVIQAASGLAGLNEHMGKEPQLFPTVFADKVGALYSVYGILAALINQTHQGKKAIKIEMPMFEALASFVLNEHLAGATFTKGDGLPGYHRLLSPNRKPRQTSDGWIVVLPYTTEHWRKLMSEIGRTDIIAMDWFNDRVERPKRVDFLYGEIDSAFAGKTTAEWLDILKCLDVPCSAVNTLDDLLKDPHLADVGFFKTNGNFPSDIARSLPQPVVFRGVERKTDIPAPLLGADSRDVLRDCGYSDADIEAMAKNGVVTVRDQKAARVA